MVTNQTLVLKALYWKGKEMTAIEISKDSGLKIKQVYMALYALKNMSYIKVRLVPIHYVDGEMINNKTFAKLQNPQLTEKTLQKRGVL